MMLTQTPVQHVENVLRQASGRTWFKVSSEGLHMWGSRAKEVYTSHERPDLRVILLEEPDPESFNDGTKTYWTLESEDVFHRRYPTFDNLAECQSAAAWLRTGIWQSWKLHDEETSAFSLRGLFNTLFGNRN